MPRRSRVLLLFLPSLVLMGVAAAIWPNAGTDSLPASGTPAAALTAEERTYFTYIAPRIDALSREAKEVAALAEHKSRNLIALQRHRQRLLALAGEIETFREEHAIPPRFAGIDDDIGTGVDLIRQAMTMAAEGFGSFDWDTVAEAIPIFENGADMLERASRSLQAAGTTMQAPGYWR